MIQDMEEDEFIDFVVENTYISRQQAKIIYRIQQGDLQKEIAKEFGHDDTRKVGTQVSRVRKKRTRCTNTLKFLRMEYDLEEI